MRRFQWVTGLCLGLLLTACDQAVHDNAIEAAPEETRSDAHIAPGAPGAIPRWSNAQKIAIGTSYEAYDETGQYSDTGPTGPISKVWFSLTADRITEVMWGLIHEAQIREARLIVVGPDGPIPGTSSFIDFQSVDYQGHPTAPLISYTENGADGAYKLTRTVYTHPSEQALIIDVEFETEREDLTVYALIDPALANTGSGDRASVFDGVTHAYEGDAHMVVRGSLEHAWQASVGFSGTEFGLTDLEDGRFEKLYSETGETQGNIEILLALPFEGAGTFAAPLVIGFGETYEAAEFTNRATLGDLPSSPLEPNPVRDAYIAGWRSYISTLEDLQQIAELSSDGGELAYMSAINLKIMEDKTHAGALIASLSNPWGETAPAETSQTGYKAVWPRDFFQVASAFVAIGDTETALAAYRYLPTVQVREDTPGNEGVTGWFLQKTHVDGTLEWVAIQQDQTAMPIMLGWKLWKAGVLSNAEMAESYETMLKPAADFLVDGGRPNILWNTDFEASLGYTQQERWEEQEGYSPSTVAAVISGLVTAADLAQQFGDPTDAARYLAAADELEANLENWMFTTTGAFGDGEYFIRITRDKDPNNKLSLGDNNGRPGLPEDQILDGGFLELVRYGVRAPNAPSILGTLPEFDEAHEDNLRVRYGFGEGIVGWRRYGNDGYGEDGERGTNYHEVDGGNTPGQRGRVWPFFSGERGHYELALKGADGDLSLSDVANLKDYVTSMEAFANEGLSLPEQVWDGVGANPFYYEFGEGTNTATPLAWTHAEYLKLLRSLSDGAVWDRYSVVAERYAKAD